MDIGKGLLVLVVLSAVAALVYGRSMNYPFIFDDFPSIVRNPSIAKLWPLWGESSPLAAIPGSPTAGRPLVNLSLAINFHFGALNPFGYHLVNLVLHVLCALLLWGITNRTLQLPYFGNRFARQSELLALLVALVWLVHPLQTETVEYVTQRTELMVGFFYLATLYGSLRYFVAEAPRERTAWLVVAGGACALGMACKEVMVTAPVVILLFERTFIAGTFQQALRRSWPLYLLLALSWGVLLLLNFGAPRTEYAGFNLGVPAHVWWFTQAKVLAMYLKLVFWPWPLAIHYRVPYLETIAAAWPWLAFAGLLGLGTLVLLWRRAAAGFLGACVFLILSPTIVIPIIKEVAVERRMYLPLAAILALVIVGAYVLLQNATRASDLDSGKAKSDRLRLAIAAVVTIPFVIALSLVSANRLTAYRDAVTIWQDAVLRDPEDYVALINVGSSLNNNGRAEEAVESMRQVLERDPDSAEANHVLALALYNLRRPLEAIPHFEKALSGPDAIDVHYHLGLLLTDIGRPGEAISHLKAVAEAQPNVAEVQNRLGIAMTQVGWPKEAIPYFELAVRLDPASPVFLANLGIALSRSGKLPEAIDALEQSVKLAPDYLDGRFQLAMAYASAGRSADAIASAEKAAEMARAANNPGIAIQIEGWLKEYRAKLPPP